jgi:site-specific DNA-cytosine methylase
VPRILARQYGSHPNAPRNELVGLYLDIIRELKKKFRIEFIVFENVLGIQDSKHLVHSGLIGWGVLRSPKYELVSQSRDRFSEAGRHLHRLGGIRWQATAQSVQDAITSKELKEQFSLSHPIQTKSRIRYDQAEVLIAAMKSRFTNRP